MTEATFRFSLALTDKIWHVVLCHQHAKLIAEVRNESNQSIVYQPLDLISGIEGKCFSIDQSDWWTNTLVFRFPYLVLEQYGDPNDPTVKTLLVYDVENESLEVSIPQFQYEGIIDKELVGVDPKNSQIEKSYFLSKMSNHKNLLLQSPVYYHHGSESCQLVERFLEIEPSGLGCEYFEADDFIIICYYVRLGTKFDRWLKVIKCEDEIYHCKLDQGMAGFAAGSFFILDNLLVFIENGKKINGVDV